MHGCMLLTYSITEAKRARSVMWLRLKIARATFTLCKWVVCTRQTFISKTFTNSLNMQKQYEKNVWETSNDTYSFSVRVQTTINNISICFLPQYQRQKKTVFLQSASWKRHFVTHWREQRGISRLAAIVVKKKTSVVHYLLRHVSILLYSFVLFTFPCCLANHPRGTNFHLMFLNLPGSRVISNITPGMMTPLTGNEISLPWKRAQDRSEGP